MTAEPLHLPRHCALFMLTIILFASFYPFSGWQYSGRPVLEFVAYPLPYYFTFYDNLVNFAVYLPYGFALALSFRPRWSAWGLALLFCALTSFAVEFVQQFIADRVASNLDFLCNLAGAASGATLARGAPFRRRLHRVWSLRRRLFRTGSPADYVVLLLPIWFVTQINPAVPLFGVVIRPAGLPQPFDSPLDNPALFLMLVEAGAAMLHLVAVLLFIASHLQQRRHAHPVLLAVIGLALLVKLAGAYCLLEPAALFDWLDAGVMIGLGLGLLCVLSALHWSYPVQAALALAALLGSQWLASLWPLDAGLPDLLDDFRWRYGHLDDTGALIVFLSRLWPWLAGLCLAASLCAVWRARRGER